MARRATPGRAMFTVSTGPEWRRVALALDAEDKALGDRFRAQLRDASDVLARRAQQEVMNIAVHTGQHSGLRARVAKGVGTKLTAGGVIITSSMNRKDETNIPAYLDMQKGWRHPVYGNRHEWVSQQTGGSWFRETIADGEQMVERRLMDVFEDAARTIAAASAGR